MRLSVTPARTDGLILLFLGGLVFVAFGWVLESSTPKSMNDFKAPYYGAKCLLEHCDPYNRDNLTRLYLSEEGERASDSVIYRSIATTNVYPPSCLIFMVPFAFLHYGPAHLLWMALIAASFLLAAFLMWDTGAAISPAISGCLVGFHLANSELLLFTGNLAAIAVSLSVVAAWCFLRDKFVRTGILCLAVSLAIKPQDAGLICLFFLLAGGTYRRRALQTLALVVALALPAIAWVTYLSPHWMQEVAANLLPLSSHGAMNDPGPASSGGHGLAMITDLQTVISECWDDPRIYNPVSYLICAPLLLAWMLVTVRNRLSVSRVWFALAAIAALTMLPIYHRQYDAKLILLTVPACMLAWNRGGIAGRLALAINALAFVVVGDLPWSILMGIVKRLPFSLGGISGRMSIMIQVFPVPLSLLAMGIFYLWLYIRWSPEPCIPAAPASGSAPSPSPS
jgi:hypothetical protein